MTTSPDKQAPKVDTALLRRLANTVRGLSIDGIEAANSGHPGLPLGCADFAVTLWYHFLRYNPADTHWPGRDKFILSGGHGSMLLYSLLHLAGFDLPMEELKNFRQWGSKTPGHPEVHLTPGVETTTGPLGQGFANAVGFGLADKMMAARVHRDNFSPFDSYIYCLCSDGDLMEGVAMEAASLAGHLGLGNLIYLYDDNDITLDAPTSFTFSGEDTAKKFDSIGWHVQKVDGFDHQAIANAIVAAQAEKERPSLILCKTIIGFGSPSKAGTQHVHGSPLGAEEAKKTKEQLGIPQEAFFVPEADRAAWAARGEELKKAYDAWHASVEANRAAHPDAIKALEGYFKGDIPADLHTRLPKFDPAKPIATRKASEAALRAIGAEVPFLVGGSADLSGSTFAIVEDTRVDRGEFKGRHIFFGVREHGMAAVVNGMVNHGAFRAFGATFLTFSDYMRGAVRLGALSDCPAIWVFTHDSIFLGEDGPTHQSVEHAAALRAIPGLIVLRPGDAVETAEAWVAALREKRHPSALILTRQNLPVYDRASPEFATMGSLFEGGYVFRKESKASHIDGILIGTGSELHLCVEAARELEAAGQSIRVVSMASWELFDRQPADYRAGILPGAITKRLAVEAGVSMGWEKYIGSKGGTVCQDRYGASAPAKVLAEKFGFTVDNVVKAFGAL